MIHKNTQAQMFFILQNIDYSQSWQKVENDLSYDLGDHSFNNKDTYDQVKLAAKNLWVVLNGFLDEEGNS